MILKRKQNTENITDINRDIGLKKAVKSNDYGKLPSNFSYVMMKKINEEVWRKEKKAEKRLFIYMILTCIVMISTCMAIIWAYMGDRILENINSIKSFTNNISISETAISNILFYLPTFISLIIIYLFNKWLRKKFGYLLKE